ncbi:MAG: geranylgeranylglyceryl phosphate synthase [Latescibacteria bacterium DG_63]|jgi:phosphoglycerol geranylgeranyltransferase|uniref:Phosphoglycerol geranylgeranyltransferase n=2 Tax=Bacteria division TA06 TaxID=1156500 RepID=A0A0S8JME7_UNCT6|nr:MAG: geranylgeranylglyceryl phosphate synthase [Latescibacteria bacterium DG_63]KPK69119.1 MAG: geranylgeranylglyceryl phosphate synthase [candidate division TA06 bacterium SM23_40]KPL10895.1 MAG: geranylgeranylglyceryl phosphate synthase [candidate division TA06 bacterium SM1_40]
MGGRPSVFENLMDVAREKGAGYLVLLDPDRLDTARLRAMAREASDGGADAILVGSSLLLSDEFDEIVAAVKKAATVPVILFPGSASQVSRHADAIFYLSLVSGRNPDLLIGEHVKAAPLLKRYEVEVISVAYMIVESGTLSSVGYMSHTLPIPRDKADIAMAHALAGEFLGMKMAYLDAGSGAGHSVPTAMVEAVRSYISIPLIVGGGIKTPQQAGKIVEAGATFVVTGNVLEEDADRLQEFARAIHREAS